MFANEALKLSQGDMEGASRTSQLGHVRAKKEQGVDGPHLETRERGATINFGSCIDDTWGRQGRGLRFDARSRECGHDKAYARPKFQ